MKTKLAFLFPGQGSQRVGMGRCLHDNFAVAREVWKEADDSLSFHLSRLCFEGPDDELMLTANTQPAIPTTSMAALRVLESETGMQPDVVAGHSLGEYSALTAAGAFCLADAVRIVNLRGRFMQEAVPAGEGAMAAIMGLSSVEIEAACAEAAQGQIVSAANLNGGGQIVIAGHKAAVDRACAAAKQRGAKRALPLAVSAPFHCALMRPAAERLAAEFDKIDIRPLRVPVVTNVEASLNQDSQRVRDLLVSQVTASVRWEESVSYMVEYGVNRAVEIGAGNVLAGLVKRITSAIEVRAASDTESIVALQKST